MKFETFTEFCQRAEEIREWFTKLYKINELKALKYKKYIYSHKFTNNAICNESCQNKAWEWCLSLIYEEVPLNDLYSTLGNIPKGH